MIDESNDPGINFFSDTSEAVDSPYFSIDEFISSSQITHLFIKLGIMAREEEVCQHMSITVLILKYQKNKALAAMI